MGKQNIGRDLSVSITLNGSVIQQIDLYSDTHIRPLWTERKVIPTNNGGVTVARPVFNGWDVDLTYFRQEGIPDTLGQYCQDNYFAGNPDILVTMQQTVRNDDGSVDVFQYINGIIYQTDAGSYKGNEDVSGTYKMFFPQRLQLTGGTQNATYSGAPLPPAVLA
jgi:hypothetical protein